MTFELLTEHHLEFLSLKGDCTGSSESTLVKIPHGWKSHVAAQILTGSGLWKYILVFQDLFLPFYCESSSLQLLIILGKNVPEQS